MDSHARDSSQIRFYFPFLQWWEGENPEYDNMTITQYFWDWQNGAILTVARIAEHVRPLVFCLP